MTRAEVFAEWFGASIVAGKVLDALFDADSVPLTRPQIGEFTGLSQASVGSGLVRLGKALEPGELITDGRRYSLTEAGLADCRNALEDARNRGIAA